MITVLMGAPGAGKTTWLNANKTGFEHVASTEAIRVHRDIDRGAFMTNMRLKAIKAAENGQDLIIDGTNTIPTHRQIWLNLANRLELQTCLVAFDTTLPLLIQAQKTRQFPAPLQIVKEHHVRMQTALRFIKSEAWDDVSIIKRGY